MITIDDKVAEDMLSFIKPRPGVPIECEDVIIAKQKAFLKKQIVGKQIKETAFETLKGIVKKTYMDSLIQPGESVGIVCGQCIGERTTQSSLNNFHSAGLDTGSTSQIDSLQNIINASKIKKKEVRKYFVLSLYLNSKPKNLRELRDATITHLEHVTCKDLIQKIEYKNLSFDGVDKRFIPFSDYDIDDIIRIDCSLEKIFQYRITTSMIVDKIESIPQTKAYAMPFSMLDEDATVLPVYIKFSENMFEFIHKLRNLNVTGIEGVESHIYLENTNTGEWYIECLCSGIDLFIPYSHIYNLNRVSSTSINDMYTHFGILAAQEVIVKNCERLVQGVDKCHFKILATRMTKSGSIEPLTRYTMRNTTSPLAKASFEESFETFLKACKFEEVEKFKSISSAIICGKKPKLGTHKCDVLVDPKFYI
jgi:DNA-directed RNA polymerase beta' subunit